MIGTEAITSTTQIAKSADMASDETNAADSPITIKTIAAKNISIPRSV